MQGPFPPQPGMQMQQGHMMGGPGPGHPMPQGMMHQGVSGPGGPATQAGPMMGMQAGAPNAHALSHLQPQQAHMFQQQQQHPGMSKLVHFVSVCMANNNSESRSNESRAYGAKCAAPGFTSTTACANACATTEWHGRVPSADDA